jgi:Flp pilus assembly protein TadB
MRMPLSEEEQRILQEMEQKLREHDRDFVERVSHHSYRLQAARGTRWSVVAFLAGTALLLATFTSSIALGVCGLLVMVVAALSFAHQLSPSRRPAEEAGQLPGRPVRGPLSSSIAGEWSQMRRRMRSRFGHRS